MSSAKNLVLNALKGVSLILILFGIVTSLQAQSLSPGQVPEAAVQSFQKSFPGVTANWAKGSGNNFEATFKKENAEQVYVYDGAGVLQLKKMKASMAQMPEAVQKSVGVAYPSASQLTAFKVISRSQEKYYEVQVAQPNGQDRLKYGLDGNLAGKSTLASTPAATTNNVAAVAPSPKPVAATPAPAPKPAAATPAPKPVAAATPKTAPVMAMRGESDDVMAEDDDLGIEIEDDMVEDVEDSFEDIDALLGDDDDDSDLLLEEGDDDEWEEVEDDDDEML